jgi:hypothetical protein
MIRHNYAMRADLVVIPNVGCPQHAPIRFEHGLCSRTRDRSLRGANPPFHCDGVKSHVPM